MFDEIVEIPEENIFMEFELDGKKIVVFSNSEELDEGAEVFFAKENEMDGERIIRNIEDREEYERVVAEYERLLSLIEEDEEDGELS